MSDRLNRLTRDDFEPLVGSAFRLAHETVGEFEARLVETSPMGSTVAPSGRSPFAVLFRGPRAEAPCQAVYSLHHESLGELELFLVPVGQEADGTLYEAVFN